MSDRRSIGRRRVVSLLAMAPFASGGRASGRGVRIVSPFPPGGSTDAVARILADAAGDAFGGPAIVETLAGAGGLVATASVARAPGDGSTLLLGTSGAFVVAPVLQPSAVGYDPERDLVALSIIAVQMQFVVVRADTPVRDARELVAWAKARREPLTFGSPGVGTTPHVAGELFGRRAGVAMLHVPYKGVAPAVFDLLAGQVAMVVTDYTSVAPFLEDGRLRAIAATSMRRSTVLPDVAPLARQGLPGFDTDVWFGLFAPGSTPPAIIDRQAGVVAQLMGMPEVRASILRRGVEPWGLAGDAARAFIAREAIRWRGLLTELRLVV